MRYLVICLFFLSGCAWLQAGLTDPEIVDSAVNASETARKLAKASGIPYADIVSGVLATWMVILFKGKKKANK